MWTRKELSQFKDSIRSEGGDSIIKVGHGETVTIRVPTHDDGNALYWEVRKIIICLVKLCEFILMEKSFSFSFQFATDSYDIAFGLFFEWNKDADETEVSSCRYHVK